MEDVLTNIFLGSLCILFLVVIVGMIIYCLPDVIDKIRESKQSLEYLKEEWSKK